MGFQPSSLSSFGFFVLTASSNSSINSLAPETESTDLNFLVRSAESFKAESHPTMLEIIITLEFGSRVGVIRSVKLRTASKLVAIVFLTTSESKPSIAIPALFTKRSIPSCLALMFSMNRLIESSEVMSSWRNLSSQIPPSSLSTLSFLSSSCSFLSEALPLSSLRAVK